MDIRFEPIEFKSKDLIYFLKDITPAAKIILIVLIFSMNKENYVYSRTVTELSKRTNLDDSTIRRNLKVLINKKYIKNIKPYDNKHPNNYEINVKYLNQISKE